MRRTKPYRFRKAKGRNISVEFDFLPGKRISTGTDDMAEAILFAEGFLKNNGLILAESVPTLREFAADYFRRGDPDSIRKRNERFGKLYEPFYYDSRQMALDLHILPYLGDYLVTAINQKIIENWIVAFHGKNGRNPKDATRNRALTILRQIMEDVKRHGYRNDNPAADTPVITVRDRTERRALTPQEQQLLFPHDIDRRVRIFGDEMTALFFSIMYDTGFRNGEVAALKVSSFFRTAGGVAVATSASLDAITGQVKASVKTAKKGYKERVGLLYDDTADLLLRYIAHEDLQNEDYLFIYHSKRMKKECHLKNWAQERAFKCACDKLGIEGVTPYCLRHTFLTSRRGDLPDTVLAVSMGHTHLRDDYDHQRAPDLIRRLESSREQLFLNRESPHTNDDIKPLK